MNGFLIKRKSIFCAIAVLSTSALIVAALPQHRALAALSPAADFSTNNDANDAATAMGVKILALASHDPTFGNIQIVAGGLEVSTVGTPSQALASHIESSQLVFSGQKVPIAYRQVARSLASLNSLSAQITKDQQSWFDKGIVMSTFGPDARTDSVLISLRKYSADAAAAVSAKYGGAVTVSTQSQPIEVASNRFADSSPWFGGDQIHIPEAGSYCTSYFSLYSTANNVAYNATAGHCGLGTAMNGSLSQGTIVSSRVVWHNGGSTDVELWPVSGNGGDVWHSNTARQVTSRSSGEIVGTSVCQDGAVTGESCQNVVTNPDAVVNEIDDNGNYLLTLQHQVLTDNAAGITATHPGDSGAPVYIIKSNGAVEAYGMLIAGGGTQMVYTPQRNIFGAYSTGLTFEQTVY